MTNESCKKLRINYILPFTEKTGGIAAICECYRVLSAQGHSVRLFYPLLPYGQIIQTDKSGLRLRIVQFKLFFRKLRALVRSIPLFDAPIPVIPVPCISDIFIKNADIVVATAWPTAFDVMRLHRNKGKKFYYVQDYEAWVQNVSAVDASYSLPLQLITISPWLTKLMETRFSHPVAVEMHCGIRHDKFSPPPQKNYSIPSVLMMFHTLETKGSFDALAAVSRIKKTFPSVPVTIFSLFQKPALDFECTFLCNPSHAELLMAYQQATIFIFPSRREGWGLPAMEAMACGCAVIATRVGCMDVIYNGKNALIVRPGHPNALHRALSLLIRSEKRRQRIGEESLKTMAALSWEQSVKKIERAFYLAIDSSNLQP